MLGFRRITRYVFREELGPTILGFSLYTFILMMNAFFLVAQRSISNNLGFDLTFRMFIVTIPSLLVLTIPMAVLLGTMIGVGRLSADSEWIAIQGAGQGLRTLVKPSMLLGALATVLSLYIFWVVVPDADIAKRTLSLEVQLASNMASDLKPRTFYPTQDGQVLFVDEIVPGSDGLLQGIVLHSPTRKEGTRELILAREGNLYPSSDGSGALEMDLRDGILHVYNNADPDLYRTSSFETYHRVLPPPPYIQALKQPVRKTVRNMNFGELRREYSAAKAEKNRVVRAVRLRMVKLEMHLRFALPVACLLFSILAVPLGVTRARSGKGAGFTMSMLVLILYYVALRLFKDQVPAGSLPPELGAWGANILILAWCLYALWKFRNPGRDRQGPITILLSACSGCWRWFSSFTSPGVRAARKEEEDLERVQGRKTRADRRKRVSFGFIPRLDLYIGVHFLKLFLYALLACYSLYGIIEFNDLVGKLMENHQPASLLFSYFEYFAPSMIPYTVPIACMVGAIITMTVFSRSGELTAIKAAGISVRRATVPILFITLMICAGFYFIQDKIIPVTNQKRQEVKDQILNRSPRTYGARPGGNWVFGSDGSRLYHYRTFDAEAASFQGLTTFRLDRDRMRILSHRYAARAAWKNRVWSLHDGWYRTFPADRQEAAYRQVDSVEVPKMDPPTQFAQREFRMAQGDSQNDRYTMSEMREEIRSLRQAGYDTTRLKVSYAGRFARTLTPLVMVILGLPFAFRVGRKGSLYGIGVAILLVIVYWATFAIFHALGLETILPPFLAAWAPNIFYGLLGTYMMLYVRT